MTGKGQAYLATRHDDVVAAIKRGESNQAIADLLGVSYWHVTRYCSKRDLFRFLPHFQKGATNA